MTGVMKEPRLAIGGLLLPEVPEWTFSERDGEVIGRPPPEGPGLLQILYVPQEELPQPVTHEFCMSVIRLVLKTASPPTDREMKESVCGPYGAATFVRRIPRGRRRGEDELIRAWYCRRLPGLIYGVYTCRESLAHGPVYERTRAACARIMSGVLFDRVGWGDADDPLTQVLLNNFYRVENDGEPL
jgi:hypothetical protein